MEKFKLAIERQHDYFRSIMVSEDLYTLLQEVKQKTNVPISRVADQAIRYALDNLEIVKDE